MKNLGLIFSCVGMVYIAFVAGYAVATTNILDVPNWMIVSVPSVLVLSFVFDLIARFFNDRNK